jgi:hypothetical protein
MRSVWCRKIILLLSLCAALSYVVIENVSVPFNTFTKSFISYNESSPTVKNTYPNCLNYNEEQTVAAAQIETTRPDSTEVKGTDRVQSSSFHTNGKLNVPVDFLILPVAAHAVAVAKRSFVFIEYHLFVNKYRQVISNLQTMR